VHRWSGSFEGMLGDVVSLQGRIARSIANELAVAVQSPPGQARRVPRISPDAYDAYLRAWHFFNNRQMAKAAEYFEAAAQKEPEFALAHAMLYEAEGLTCYGRDIPLSDRALTAMRRALELDENLSEAHTDAGDYRFYWQWDWEGGMAEYRRAIELDRGSVHTALHYAAGLMHLGRWDESVREFRRALRLDPFSQLLNDALLSALVNAHRYEEALAHFRQTLELSPNQPNGWRHAAAAYARLGRDAEAVQAALRADQLENPEGSDWNALRRAADAGGLSGIAKERLRQAKLRPNADRWPPVRWALLYAAAGDTDQAFRMLEAAYSRHSPQLAWIKCSYAYDPLRSDPRFESLIRRMRFP
jgi:tetratricopeptide (TPR) repeat protein